MLNKKQMLRFLKTREKLVHQEHSFVQKIMPKESWLELISSFQEL